MKAANLADVATIAIIVHGVGDHSATRILWSAAKGLRALPGQEAKVEEVEIPSLPELESIHGEPGIGMAVESGAQHHLVIPMVWSRLRPRAANEADFQVFQPATRTLFNKLFQSAIFLLPACMNAIRCIPAATGLVRRLLVAAIALSYGFFVPAILLYLFNFASYLVMLRVSLDKQQHLWWRWPLLLIVFWLMYWIVGKFLMVCDFMGDVVGYVGNRKLRQKAEERLLGVIRKLANAAPGAQILVIGHSLGSVLVTHSLLQLKGNERLTARVEILTMGSPLKLMSWLFPARILSPEKILNEFDQQQRVVFWANMWRDADVIGRSLKIKGLNQPANTSRKFGEISLGDGTHTDYWADRRCWLAVINYLGAVAQDSVLSLAAAWKDAAQSPLSADETNELHQIIANRNWAVFELCCIIYIGLLYFGYVHRWSTWFPPICLIVASIASGFYRFVTQTITVPSFNDRLGWHNFSNQQLNVPGEIQRELLARNRLGCFIEKACLGLACAIAVSTALSLILWKFFTT